jgi:hypothetical protein
LKAFFKGFLYGFWDEKYMVWVIGLGLKGLVFGER